MPLVLLLPLLLLYFPPMHVCLFGLLVYWCIFVVFKLDIDQAGLLSLLLELFVFITSVRLKTKCGLAIINIHFLSKASIFNSFLRLSNNVNYENIDKIMTRECVLCDKNKAHQLNEVNTQTNTTNRNSAHYNLITCPCVWRLTRPSLYRTTIQIHIFCHFAILIWIKMSREANFSMLCTA